ncbi:MAG: M28 family peptidase [Candidatus Bathyarchaeia archaeon]
MFNKISSVILCILLFTGIFVMATNFHSVIAWIGTVYIRADGAIEPADAPILRDGDVYILIGNITSNADGIVIERDDMKLDGAGCIVQGNGEVHKAGVLLVARHNVTITNMEITKFYYGIRLDICQNCSIIGNNLHQTMLYGKANIDLVDSSYNTIVGNNLTDNWIGIGLHASNYNVIRENNVTKHSAGIYLQSSYNNSIHHNSFLFNDNQVDIYDSANAWDDNYPSGGNLWSDYWGVDSYSGVYQNETRSDGIGDTPRIIDENNIDRYPLVYPRDPCEQQIVSLVNGSRAYNHDLELENMALEHYAFRSGGSAGANETVYWIKEKFESFGLEAWLEPFEFTTWDVTSKPSLVIDDDGNPNTTYDQTVLSSFQCEHYSWPTSPNGAFADLVILPLPEAASYFEIGVNPINTTAWNAINTTGKIVLIGREVRWSSSWHNTYRNKLTAQPPAAIVHTWWYEWMSFTPPMYSSAGGRPISSFGDYYWDLGIPVGSVNYEDGLWIRNRESGIDVSANVSINSVIGMGTHYNVVGRIKGYIDPDKMIIISGHYDTVMCAGFCDNGAGTAGVIELAKVFADAVASGVYKPAYTLLFVAFASEELYLVGSINYVKQHKSDMANIKAVINLDCIGSDEFRVTETEPVNGFDLDQVVLEAALELGVSGELESPGGSDQETFRNPLWANSIYYQYWGLDANISDATPIPSSVLLISFPLLYNDAWYMGSPGWIHTEYDNSTSTLTLNWVEAVDLEKHIQIAALTTVRISPNVPPLPRNIALTSVKPSKTVSGQSFLMQIKVTIENQGGYIEYVNVTAYANATVIATLVNIVVANGTSVTVAITWNTTEFEKGNYTIRAYAWPFPDETSTTDNNCTFNGFVLITLPGDVDGDFKVKMDDIVLIVGAFGSTLRADGWYWHTPPCILCPHNPNYDVDGNSKVDMGDIIIACDNFGKTYL